MEMDRKTKRAMSEDNMGVSRSDSKPNGKRLKRKKPSDVQFAQVIEQINEGFVALDGQMNYLYINKRGSEILQRERDHLIGKNYWDEYPEDKHTSFGQAYLRALETQTPIELEDYDAAGDRWFENRIYPTETGLSIFFNDITERKRAEAVTRENEERFQTLANGSPVLLWVNGLEGCEFVNREYLDFLGLAEQTQVHGYDWSQFVHPEDRDAYLNTYLRAFEKQAVFSTEFRFRRYDGEYRWMRSEATPRRGVDGSFSGYVGASIDITLRKRAELASHKNEHQLRLITDAMPALISYIDSEYRYRFVNQAYREWFSYSHEEVLGKTAMEVLGMAAFEKLHPHMEAALTGKTEIFETETPYQRGGTRFIRATYTPDIAADGAVNGFFVLVLDITERKQADEALAEYARQQASLYQLTDRLQHAKSLEDIYNAALDAILSALQCNRASILLFDKENIMRFVAWRGLSNDYRSATDGHSPWTADEKNPEPICMDDIRTAELSDSLRTTIKAEGIGSLAFIPLVFKGKLIGKFMCYFNEPHAFTERETDLSLTIAHQLATGIERKRDEDAFRTSEERLRLATQAAQMFSWEFDLQNQTSMVADNFAEAVGFSAGLIPKHKEEILQTFIHPEDAQRIFVDLMKAIEDRSDLRSVQFRILNPENRQPVWLEVNGKVTYDRDGNPERMFGVAQNITENKQTEEYIRYLNSELQAKLDEMNTLLEILPTGVWIGNHDCSEIIGNSAAYAMLGLTPGRNVSIINPEPQESTGLRVFVNGEEVDPDDAPMQLAARTGKPLYGFEHELFFPDGSRKVFYASAIPLFDEDGSIRKVIASYTDFTERKQAEDRLALLAEVSELTRQIEDPDDLTYAIANAVGKHLQVKRCLFNETDLERDVEIIHSDYHEGVESVAGVHKISDYSSITSADMAAGKTVVNNDSKIDPRTAQDYERTYAVNGERAYVAVPMMRDNRWVGTLWVSDDKPRQWRQEDISLLETIAERTWTVIEKLRINIALRESEARYRFIVENTSDGIWHVELNQPMPISISEEEQLNWYYEHAVIRQCNLGLAHMYGYDSVEAVVGLPMREVMPREDVVNMELTRQFIRSNYRLVDAESREVSRDGRELVFLNNMIGVIEDGRLTGEWGTNRNITERKRLEEEREELLQQEQALRASAERAKIEAEQAKAEAERELAERRMAEAALGEWAGEPLPQDKRSPWLRYGAAIVVTLVASLLRVVLDPILGDILALVTIYGAVAFSVWYGGVGPAILSALLGYVAITGLIVDPGYAVTLNAQNITGFALFLFSNTVVMALGESMRRAQGHAHQSASVAIERQHQVEAQLQEKQLVEASLRQSEALYRGIARSIPGGGVYVVDKDFRYLVAEGSVTESFDLSRERLEGRTVSEAFPKEQSERMEARLRRNFAGETVDYETKHNERVYWTQQAPLLDSMGQVLIVTIDITERKRAEEALRRSEERFARFMQYLPGLAWIKDTDGRYIYANEAAARAFHTPIEELYGKTDEEIFPAEVAAQFRKNDELALMDEKGVQVTETLQHEDGVLHYSLVSKFPIPGPDGSTILIGGTAFDITERLLAEEALRESEARLRAVFDGTYEYIGLLSPEGTLLEANRASLEFDNNTHEEVIGRPFWETPWWLYTPGAPEALRNSIERAADGEFIRYEAPLNRRSGETIIFDFSLHPIRDEQGKIVFLVPEGRNITDRKEAEEALRESEDRFRAILSQATAGIVRKDVEGRFIFVNEAFCNMLGYTEAELLGKTFSEFTHPDDRDENKRLYDRAMTQGIPFKMEKRLLHQDGSILWVDVSVSPVMDLAGKPQSAVAVEVDITKRKQAEQALVESERRFREMIDALPAAIYTTDAEGRLTHFNPAVAEFSGRAPQIGTDHWCVTWKLYYPDGTPMPNDQCPMAVTLREGREVRGVEAIAERPDGTRVWFEPYPTPLRDRDGKIVGGINMLVDITERKQTEETLHQLNLQLESRVQRRTVELQSANQSLRDEIAERLKVEDALHESRKRLQILTQRLVDVQEDERRAIARELHDRVGQSLSALNINLVILDNQIADHVAEPIRTRLDDSMQLVAETITLVRDVMSDLRPPILDDYGLEAAMQSQLNSFKSRYEIDVQFEKPEQPIPRLSASIEMTFLRIAQEALINVARHAKASQVTLSLRQEENAVRLVIQDNGEGIRSWQEANRPGSHGLTIMRERAEAFGGDLKVTSVLGQGVEVDVSIPIDFDEPDDGDKESRE